MRKYFEGRHTRAALTPRPPLTYDNAIFGIAMLGRGPVSQREVDVLLDDLDQDSGLLRLNYCRGIQRARNRALTFKVGGAQGPKGQGALRLPARPWRCRSVGLVASQNRLKTQKTSLGGKGYGRENGLPRLLTTT